MLCTLMLNSLLDTLMQLDWTAGEQFRVVTVSFDPAETHQLASVKRQNYLKQYERPAAAYGWEFLTGRKPSIDPLLDATGFRVRWNEDRKEWMHVAALIICTPDGRISRYLINIVYDPKTLRLSLVEASEGKIGTPLDRIILYCYHYEGGQYTLAAMNIVRAAGLFTLLVVALFLAILWRRERRRGKAVALTHERVLAARTPGPNDSAGHVPGRGHDLAAAAGRDYWPTTLTPFSTSFTGSRSSSSS